MIPYQKCTETGEIVSVITFIFELIGTIAFSVSGALVAIEKKMDLLGVIILGLMTAVGGGMLRDITLGQHPPQALANPVYFLIAVAVSLIVFLPVVRHFIQSNQKAFDIALLVMDSIGLGVFTVVGIAVSKTVVPDGNLLLQICIGVLTAVGGGVMRDVLAGQTPFIFIKHFYACASLIGALVCAALWKSIGMIPAMSAGALTVIILRFLAARFHWELPKS